MSNVSTSGKVDAESMNLSVTDGNFIISNSAAQNYSLMVT